MNAARPIVITDPLSTGGDEPGGETPSLYEITEMEKLARWRAPRDASMGDDVARALNGLVDRAIDQALAAD